MSINNVATAYGEHRAPPLASIIKQADSIKIEANKLENSTGGQTSGQQTQNPPADLVKVLPSGADNKIEAKSQGEQAGELASGAKAPNGAVEDTALQSEELSKSLQQVSASSSQLSSLQLRKLEFSASEEAGKVVVKVIDKENDDVIRQIPSEEFIRVAQKISDLSQELDSAQQGLLFESKA